MNTVEGPLGFPLTDRQASALESLLKALPRSDEFRYRRWVLSRAPTELTAGERADVSWISTEAPDRCNDVVIARGMNDAQFQLNPLVTLNHCYTAPPVGRSLWRKRVREGDTAGIKAKTHYPSRPADWPAGKDWPPDVAFALVRNGLLAGKSIGFLPTKVHTPAERERQRPGWDKVELVIDEWILLEYACCFLPVQPNAIVEAVSKSDVPVPAEFRKALGLGSLPPVRERLIPHTPLAEVDKAIARHIEAIDWEGLAHRSFQDQLDRLRGRV